MMVSITNYKYLCKYTHTCLYLAIIRHMYLQNPSKIVLCMFWDALRYLICLLPSLFICALTSMSHFFLGTLFPVTPPSDTLFAYYRLSLYAHAHWRPCHALFLCTLFPITPAPIKKAFFLAFKKNIFFL